MTIYRNTPSATARIIHLDAPLEQPGYAVLGIYLARIYN